MGAPYSFLNFVYLQILVICCFVFCFLGYFFFYIFGTLNGEADPSLKLAKRGNTGNHGLCGDSEQRKALALCSIRASA